MGFSGPKFTWSYGVSTHTRKAARLDRALCDTMWRSCFPSATLRHLPHAHSDHCPLLLKLSTVDCSWLGHRPFRFTSAWLRHPDFNLLVNREWKEKGGLQSSLSLLTESLWAWNVHTFGDIFQRKKRLSSRLEGIQRAMGRYCSNGLLSLERRLNREWEEVLFQEEMLWIQKSRVEWIKEGDMNTKFFHLSTLIRRRQNRIDSLLNSEGQWVTDKEGLKCLAVEFYKSLFTAEQLSAGGRFVQG